ncbi:hypothetical protein HDR60_05725 [bacterium]|nr:hypothetical protein [bacterium]
MKVHNITSRELSIVMRKIAKLNEGKTLEDVTLHISSTIITDVTINGLPKKYEYDISNNILKEININQK